MTINIFQVPSGTNVNVGCGCGPGGSGGGALPPGGPVDGLPPGGTPGGPEYEGAARVIDICANVETIFQDAIAEWINAVQNRGYIPSGAESILPTDVTNFLLDAMGELEDELYQPEYTLALRRWIVRRFTDPFPGFGTDWYGVANFALKRTQLLNTLPQFPYVVAGAPFRDALKAWALTADIEALNARIKASAGTASYTGECAQLQREAGREPYVPPALEGGVIVLESESYKYTRLFSGESEPDGGFSLDIAGTDFAGFLIYQRVTGGTGTGTVYTHGAEFTHTEGETNITGSVGSGSKDIDQFFGSGITNVGQVAFDEFPTYFAGWDGQTNPKNPSAATFPAIGAFTGTVTGNNQLGTKTIMDVWLVTALTGEASLA